MRGYLRELIGTLMVALIFFLLLKLVVGSYSVISASMEPDFQVGQGLVVNKLAYKFHEPVRGDIVFYKSPEGEVNQMKRIIGLPGDIVEVQGGAVYLNGQKLNEPYVTQPAAYEVAQFQVPAGCYFILEDNRNNSNESTSNLMVPAQNIQGKAWIVSWPPDKWGAVGNYNLTSQLTAAEMSD